MAIDLEDDDFTDGFADGEGDEAGCMLIAF
jgi:hypothetical protein